MTLTRRILFGAAAAWFSRGLTILLGLVLMPVLFRTLPQEELGLWLLIGQSAAVLGILDFGFGVTLTRRIAFARGRSSSDPQVPLTEASRAEIADLTTTGLRVYRVLALIAFLLSTALGFAYLRSLELETVALATVWIAWTILCLSHGLTLWAAPWTALLQGVGQVGWDALIASFTGALTLVAQILAALAGGGLLTLALVAAAGALVQRFAILAFARRRQPGLFQLRGRWRGDWFREMVPYAGKAWLTAVGTVLALNSDPFLVAKVAGARELPAYRAAYLVLVNLNMVAVTMASASSVFVSHLWASNEKSEIRRLVLRNLRAGLFLMAVGGAWLLATGPIFFDWWLGPGNFAGSPLIALFLGILVLEAQGYITSSAARATEDEAFGPITVLGGLLKIAFSWLLLEPFGLPGIALGTLLGQLLTSHWFTVYRSLRRLEWRFPAYLLEVVLPVLVVFVVVRAGCQLTLMVVDRGGVLSSLAVSGAFATLLLAVSGWFLVLDPGQRRCIVRRARGASRVGA